MVSYICLATSYKLMLSYLCSHGYSHEQCSGSCRNQEKNPKGIIPNLSRRQCSKRKHIVQYIPIGTHLSLPHKFQSFIIISFFKPVAWHSLQRVTSVPEMTMTSGFLHVLLPQLAHRFLGIFDVANLSKWLENKVETTLSYPVVHTGLKPVILLHSPLCCRVYMLVTILELNNFLISCKNTNHKKRIIDE